MALAPAARPAGLAPPLATGVARRHHLVARQHGGRREGERGAGALGDLLVDLAAERRPVERAEPGLLPEHVLGLGPGQHVALDLVHPVLELGQGAGLGQDGGGDGTGRRGRDDVGGDPLHADEVLEHPDLEGSLGPAAGQHERGGSRGGSRRHRTIVAPHAARGQRRSAAGGGAHHLDEGTGAGGRGRPLRAWDDTAVHGNGHALGVILGGQRTDQVGDGGAGRHLAPARR